MAWEDPVTGMDPGKGGEAREILEMTGRVCLTPGMRTIRSLFIPEKLAREDTKGRSC